MNDNEILDIKFEIMRRFLLLKERSRFSYHESAKAYLSEWAFKKGLIAIPEYVVNHVIESRRKGIYMRCGKMDMVIKSSNGKLLYGIEIDKGLSKNSIQKLLALKAENSIIVSLSSNVERYSERLPPDFILINVPIKHRMRYF